MRDEMDVIVTSPRKGRKYKWSLLHDSIPHELKPRDNAWRIILYYYERLITF